MGMRPASHRPLPAWAAWSFQGAEAPWTVGIEEEVMLLEPEGWTLASRIDDVLPALPPEVVEHATAETHGAALELATDVHGTVGAAIEQLGRLRARLAAELRTLGLGAAVAGTHPFAEWRDVEISPGARYQSIHDSMRELARREPTFALHVHVAVPDGESAVRALNGVRRDLPVLLALAANSPFWQGRETGLASARTPVFGTFPRVGIPRRFPDYAAYAEAIDVLLRCGAFPEPTFLWWDARLQPRFGTIEVRAMDAQTRLADTAGLVALVQCLVRRAVLEVGPPEGAADAREVLEENRFIAARDGMRAELIDPDIGGRVPVRERLDDLLEACAPHAVELGCTAELAGVRALADAPGEARQRQVAGIERGEVAGAELARVVAALNAEFTTLQPAGMR